MAPGAGFVVANSIVANVALDQHVANGRGDSTALIYDSPATSVVRKYTYRELLEWTARVAGGLSALGAGER